MEDMKKKIILAGGAVIAVIAVICCCVGIFLKKSENSYRMIQALEVSGTVTVERTDIGAVEVYEGMRIQSGDVISVAEGSWLTLQMDEDKYALVEPNSRLRLEATGSSADSKTSIFLESGAISNRLESELSDDSVYEVNTPNSTMAVRGTVFRVEVSFNEEGVSITNVSVYNGTVESRLNYPDGTSDGKDQAVMIISGTGVQIWGDDTTSDYVSIGNEIDLEELQLETLYFLRESYGSGTELSISEEELEELITRLEENLNSEEGEPESTETQEESTEAEPEEEEEEPAEEEPEEEDEEAATSESTETTSTPVVQTNPVQTTSTEHTVTFSYQGNVFATQTVQHNATASAPVLQPTASGKWNFTFSTPITADTTVEWVDSSTQ